MFGVSYGTRLALEAARRHPEGIESLVLDSVYPPEAGGVAWLEHNGVDAIDRLVEGCLAEPGCAAKFPGLAANIETAMASLDAQPYSTNVENTFGDPVELQLTGADMYASVFEALYDSNVIPFLPYVIALAGFGGNFEFLGQAASDAVPGLTRFAEGARYSIDCVDGGQFIDDEGAALADSLLAHPELATLYQGQAVPFCAIWDVAPAPVEFTQPVVSDIPTLILAGEFDPVTPVWQSELAAATLSNAELFVFPGFGHAVSFDGDCSASLVREFLVESTVIDEGCWAALSPITFP
ncbi:MAG: alpha/beta hydrolase [Deltaproteobacteria bacterium]|nr:alpha/beta hydrolase [Deltaproteobacteria bacterium]